MSTTFARSELQEIATNHKLLLWSILVGLIANFVRLKLPESIGYIVFIAAAIFQIFALAKLAAALKFSTIKMVILGIGLLIPLLGLLMLLYTHNETLKTMKAAGIKVGFMGPDPKSI
jgi:hypothetical protein